MGFTSEEENLNAGFQTILWVQREVEVRSHELFPSEFKATGEHKRRG